MYPTFHLGPYTFHTFGIMLGLSICAGCYAFALYFERHHLPVNMLAWGLTVIPVGFLAARLDDTFLAHARHAPLSAYTSQIATGGLTYYGGLLVSLLAFVLFILVSRLPMLRMLDSLFCVGLAYAIGRIGCFLSGDGDYGIPSNLPWAMSFPHGSVPTLIRVHPNMLYITLYELVLFAILWRLSSRRLTPGTLLGLYLILTSTGRFLIEFLSRNRALTHGLTEAQCVSLALAAIGATVLLTTRKPSTPSRLTTTHN